MTDKLRKLKFGLTTMDPGTWVGTAAEGTSYGAGFKANVTWNQNAEKWKNSRFIVWGQRQESLRLGRKRWVDYRVTAKLSSVGTARNGISSCVFTT